MATMADVRAALLRAYGAAQKSPDGIEGKSDEAHCTLRYQSWWETEGDFNEPYQLEVYSYALGPSRRHYFDRAEKARQVNYYTWEGPDIFAKAVEVIDGWAANIGRDD